MVFRFTSIMKGNSFFKIFSLFKLVILLKGNWSFLSGSTKVSISDYLMTGSLKKVVQLIFPIIGKQNSLFQIYI